MIYRLDPMNYGKIRPLFRSVVQVLPLCRAALEGIQEGQVFVDNLAHPTSALMITWDVWGYLAGDPCNDRFNRALNQALFSGEIIDKDAFGLLLHCHPTHWRNTLPVVFQPRQPIEVPRRQYVGRETRYDWRANTPQGFEIQWIDEALLERIEAEVPDDVKRLLEKRGPHGDPLKQGFGFVAVYDGKIVAHAVVDCIVGEIGEIGLFTTEAFRRRGLATVTSAAAVEYGLAHGMAAIIWDCSATNTGSVRTAEKLGFVHERDHTMYVLSFDEIGHLVNMAWQHLEAGRYHEVLDAFEQIRALADEPPPHAYFPAACACAGLQKRDKALDLLNIAADRGWSSVVETESYRELESLQDMPEWPTLLARIMLNSQAN